MTVQREIVKLLITKEQALNYSISPPPEATGITVNWLEWLPLKPHETENDQKVIAEFITSDRFLVRSERKTEKDIRYLLGTTFRNHLIDKGLTHPASPTTALRIFAPLKHPIFNSPDTPADLKRAAETARDVRNIFFTDEEIKNSHHPEIQAEYVKDAERGQRTRQMMKKFAIEPEYPGVREKIVRDLGPEKGYVEEEGPERKAYQYGEIESG